MLKTIAELRIDYAKGTLLESQLPINPLLLFNDWFQLHQDSLLASPAYVEPNAMVLATCCKETCRPSSRVVLLKGVDERGFVFFTNYTSQKSLDLLGNPYAALTFYWDQRQVRIEGKTEKISPQESDDYFKSRPIKSQIGAWASSQSTVLVDRNQLEEEMERLTKKFGEGGETLTRPDFWGGFRVVPENMEFWQGRRSRLHDRFRYSKEGESWTRNRLSP